MREEITNQALNEVDADLKQHLMEVLGRKGYESFSSRHEILGVLKEETDELFGFLSLPGGDEHTYHELMDVAVACIFAAACYKQGTLEW